MKWLERKEVLGLSQQIALFLVKTCRFCGGTGQESDPGKMSNQPGSGTVPCQHCLGLRKAVADSLELPETDATEAGTRRRVASGHFADSA